MKRGPRFLMRKIILQISDRKVHVDQASLIYEVCNQCYDITKHVTSFTLTLFIAVTSAFRSC